jgi:hypothetical protein
LAAEKMTAPSTWSAQACRRSGEGEKQKNGGVGRELVS